MSAEYPDAIVSPRTIANRPGVVFDPDDTKTFFAEDLNAVNDEVVAIETELGENPKGAFATVAAYLSALTDAINDILANNKVMIEVYQSSGQSISDSTLTVVNLQTEIYDKGSNFASNKFTAPRAGMYQISAQIIYPGMTDQKYGDCILRLNGATYLQWKREFMSGSYNLHPACSKAIYLAAGDYVQLIASHNKGSAVTLSASGRHETFMTVAEI